MHPVIRIVTTLCSIAMLVNASWPAIGLFATVVLCLVVLAERQQISRSSRMVYRLKWLFLSIAIIYLWWTPGTPLLLLDVNEAWMPTSEGLEQALLRIAVLVLIIFGVNLVLSGMQQAEAIAAIRWMLLPLAKTGIDIETFSIRSSLVVRYLSGMREDVSSEKSENTTQASAWTRIIETLVRLYRQAIDVPVKHMQPIEIPEIKRPGLLHWLIPVGVVGITLLVNHLAVRTL